MGQRTQDFFEDPIIYQPPPALASWGRVFAWCVFCFALLVRLTFLKQLQDSSLWDELRAGLLYDRDWALRIAAGDWIGTGAFERGPLYSYVLAFFFKLFGPDLLAPRLAQAVIGAASCVLIYLTGRAVFSPLAGLAAGVMAAVYGPFLLADGMISKEVLAVFFLSAMTWQIVEGNGSQRGLLGTAGICLGLGALVREDLILLAPAVAFWLLIDPWLGQWVQWHRLGEGIGRVMTFLFCIALVIAPVAARNFHVSGEIVPLTTSCGAEFYTGNNAEADGYDSPPAFAGPALPGGGEEFRIEAARRMGKPAGSVTHAAASIYWARQGLDWVATHPRDYLGLVGRKLLIFWNRRDLPGDDAFTRHKELLPILRMPLPAFGLLVPLAAAGVFLSARRWRDLLLLYMIAGGCMASALVLFNLPQHRLAAAPALMVLAGIGIVEFAISLARRRFAVAAIAGALAIVVFLITGLDV